MLIYFMYLEILFRNYVFNHLLFLKAVFHVRINKKAHFNYFIVLMCTFCSNRPYFSVLKYPLHDTPRS